MKAKPPRGKRFGMCAVGTVFRIPAGWVAAAGTERGLKFLSLPVPSKKQALQSLQAAYPDAVIHAGLRGDISARALGELLARYFRGEIVEFAVPLDPDGSAFAKRAWRIVRGIPHGELRSYGWVAKRLARRSGNLGRLPRMVGLAMRRNRIPVLIPCHRVIRADGTPGGFSAGARWKHRLLHLEITSTRGVSLRFARRRVRR